MKIFVKKGKLVDTKSQAIILPLFEENKNYQEMRWRSIKSAMD